MSETMFEKYSSLAGRKVTLVTFNPDRPDDRTERRGTLHSINKIGPLFIPRGKTSGEPIFWHEIVSIVPIEVAVASKSRKMGTIDEGKVRQHLLDRHGLSLAEVATLTEVEAVKVHTELHVVPRGHHHED